VSATAPTVRTADTYDRDALTDWYLRNRRRSQDLFDMLAPETYYARPIALRNPIVFYEGHLPAFSANTLLRRGLGVDGIDDHLDRLFARGIDPDDEASATPRVVATWPARDRVREYAAAADRAVLAAIRSADFARTDRPVLCRAEGVYALLEHEAMHQETLLYMWHQLPHAQKRRPSDGTDRPIIGGEPPAPRTVRVPAGLATLGARRDATFGWDNEFVEHQVEVGAFDIDVYNVTNRDFLAFVEAGGYQNRSLWSPADWAWVQEREVSHPSFWVGRGGRWFWRGMFEDVPLPAAWPIYVAHAEAAAYARWKGRRLVTEAEFHRAAYGDSSGSERAQPWGAAPADPAIGNFDFTHWDPVPVGSYAAGVSAWGVHDLIGNGWEWTATVFAPFEGFEPMASYPEYSADFFDGQHFVMKGASPGTARELVRRSFRNWFRPQYPYVYATFRTVG
jgi:ergothioneine biosynthesis protein EgtB